MYSGTFEHSPDLCQTFNTNLSNIQYLGWMFENTQNHLFGVLMII
jgi:hypothetical protein